MTLPIIAFKSTNVDVDESLQDFVTKKFAALDKFIGDETDVKCEVEFEKVASHHSGKIHRVETNLWLRGRLYRAEATEGTFEAAAEEVRNELDKEVRRAQRKRDSLVRRGGRKLKAMLRWGE